MQHPVNFEHVTEKGNVLVESVFGTCVRLVCVGEGCGGRLYVQ